MPCNIDQIEFSTRTYYSNSPRDHSPSVHRLPECDITSFTFFILQAFIDIQVGFGKADLFYFFLFLFSYLYLLSHDLTEM